MAEKVVLVSADIDTTKAVKDAQALRTEVEKLKAKTEELKKTQGETSKEYVEASAQLKATQSELRSHENILGKVVAANKANTGSISQMRAELSVVSKAWADLSKEERLNSDTGKQLAARKLELTEALKAEEKATGDTRRNVGNYTKAMQGLPGKIGNATSSIMGMVKAGKAFIATPLGAIIAAITVAVTALVAIFKTFDPVIDRIQRGIAGLKAAFSVLKESVIGVITGQTSLREALKGTAGAMKDAAKEAIELRKAQEELEDRNITLTETQAKYKRQIDELLLQSKDRTKSEYERIALIDQALEVEKKAYDERAKLASDERKNVEDSLANDHKLTETELANLRDRGSAYAILLKDRKAITDEEIKMLADAIAKEENILGESIAIREKAINRQNALIEKAEEESTKRREEARLAALATEAEQKLQAAKDELAMFVEIEGVKETIQQEKRNLYGQTKAQELEAAQMNYENELALLEGSLFGELELERIALEQKEAQEIAAAERIGANTQVIEKKYLKAKLTIARTEKDAKLALAGDFMKNIATIAGEQTAIGKAAAVAGTTIDTFRGAQAAFTGMTSTIPGPVGIGLGIAAAAAAVVSGLANVKKILAVKSGLPGEGSVSGSGGGGSAVTPTAIATVNPEIGAGIVSRESSVALPETTQAQQTVLVVDDVTAKQTTQSSQQVTATL